MNDPTDRWPAASVELRALHDLHPDPRNPRTHTPEQVDAIAASIREWGWTVPVLVDEAGLIIAGHGRALAAAVLGLDHVPTMVARGWTDAQRRAYVIADNQLTIAGGWDRELLGVELRELDGLGVDLDLLGFSSKELDALTRTSETAREELAEADADPVDATGAPLRAKLGDVWVLGDHRVVCGDSTDAATIARLFAGGELADLVHADPPYGMGKEADGIKNDNLHGGKLDAFQLAWLRVALAHARPNCSLYVWGNAPDLWRLWYRGGLDALDELHLRNELVWAKGTAIGMASDDSHSYPPETERCLLLMRGPQFIGNQNKDDYWEGFEPLRAWLVEQRDACGWTARDANRVTGTQMAGLWFGKSQFQPITRAAYDALRAEAAGLAFDEPYDTMLARFVGGKAAQRRDTLSAAMRESRSYFDASTENSTDVWSFPRVTGDERFGHATPKPVAMIGRAVTTSCPDGGLVFEPFLGTGSTLVAAELTGRRCFGAELEPRYVDVVIHRWETATGKRATLEGDAR